MGDSIVCIDVDNTLADYTGGIRRYVRERCGDGYPCPDPLAYDFSLTEGWPFTGSADSYLDWHRRAVGDSLYAALEPFDGAAEAARGLHDAGCTIIVSTSRSDDGDRTLEWLRRHGVPFDRLHHGRKTDLLGRFDVLVDDKPDVIAEAARHGATVLHPDSAYCRDAPGVAYHDWTGAAALILCRA